MDLSHCDICPRRCGANRTAGGRGFCGAGENPRVALVSLHRWEEPCLVGERGAGTVFFSHCNMKCAFCQNYELSHAGRGTDITIGRLSEIFLEQQRRGAATLDLVTPTHYTPQIVQALADAKSRGLTIPVVYNCGGYELPETLEALRGLVDIFLPDMKYKSEALARECSAAPDYFRCACAALEKMFDLVGPCVMEGTRMVRGMIVRHLVLPWNYRDSIAILDYLKATFGDAIYISLMSQFTPMPQCRLAKMSRRLTSLEYGKVVSHAREIGITKCFIQQGGSAEEKFIPNFDGRNVLSADDLQPEPAKEK